MGWLEREAGLQVRQGRVDARERVGRVVARGPGHGGRQDHADDRTYKVAHGKVAGVAPDPPRRGLGDDVDCPAELVDRLGAQLSGLPLERGDDDGVHVILDHHVFLGREVAEERARRDLGRLGDLLDGRGVVTLLPEQPERVLPDGSTRSGLLALAEALRSGRALFAHDCHSVLTGSDAIAGAPAGAAVAAWPRSGAGWTAASAGVPARRGRKASASNAAARAMPAQHHSITSRPCTNATSTSCISDAEPSVRATSTPPEIPERTAPAAEAGSPVRFSLAW